MVEIQFLSQGTILWTCCYAVVSHSHSHPIPIPNQNHIGQFPQNSHIKSSKSLEWSQQFIYSSISFCVPLVGKSYSIRYLTNRPRSGFSRKNRLPRPAPPRKIDEIRGAQRGKTDCRFHWYPFLLCPRLSRSRKIFILTVCFTEIPFKSERR